MPKSPLFAKISSTLAALLFLGLGLMLSSCEPGSPDKQDSQAGQIEAQDSLHTADKRQTKDSIAPKMEWFRNAKLGIFIHFGIYAVDGVRESWSFYRGTVTKEDYYAQRKRFTASNYNPTAWAELFKEAGARYAVLTAKHHDGVALYDSKYSQLDVVDTTPAERDLVGPYTQALRKEGLKVGLYFSHLDWGHPDYASVYNHEKPDSLRHEDTNRYAYPQDEVEQPKQWEQFLTFHRQQIKEIITRYDPDLLWFDGDWERSKEQWRMKELRQQIMDWSDGPIILNSRMKGYGDYATPEQYIPLHQKKEPWELCLTLNESWGYQPRTATTKAYLCWWTSLLGSSPKG